MEDNQEKKRVFEEMSVLEALEHLGKMQVSVEKTILVMARANKIDEYLRIHITIELQNNDEHSPYFIAYQKGKLMGELELQEDLLNAVKSGDKDAYKELEQERKKQKISEKINELFG